MTSSCVDGVQQTTTADVTIEAAEIAPAANNSAESEAATADEAITIDPATTENVGIIVNRPKPPMSNLFPDFQSDMSIAGGAPADSVGETLVRAVILGDPPSVNLAELWTGIFAGFSVASAQNLNGFLYSFGASVVEASAGAGIVEALEAEQTATLDTPVTLIETLASWDVILKNDPVHAEYVRYYFKNRENGGIEASYAVKTNDAGEPLRGIFAYVRPELLTPDAKDGKRLFLMAFDVSDPAQNLLVTRVEDHDDFQGGYYAYQIHEQCDVGAARACLGEYLESKTPADMERWIDPTDMRFFWQERIGELCIVDMDYSEGAIDFGETSLYKPYLGKSEIDGCTIEPVPLWGEHVFTPDDLVLRYGDTVPAGGTALQYYVDGFSTSGWDALTPALIDGWLDGSGLRP